MSQPSLMAVKRNETPKNFAAFMQEKGDIFWWPAGNFWVITSHAYAKEILTSEDFTCDRSSFFISRMPEMDLSLIQDFFAVVSKMMVMSDAPKHTARRRICYDGFSNHTLDEMRPKISSLVEQQLERAKKKGEIELVEDFAKMLPSTILAEFFAIPDDERENFYSWSNNMTQFFGGSSSYKNQEGIEVNNSAANLKKYFVSLIAERRARPKEDFLSILLKNQQAFGLDDDDIISQAIMMLVAGQVTTTDQMCNNMFELLQSGVALDALRAGEIDMQEALDELNRLDPAVTFIFRVTKNDTQIGDKNIKANDVIFISTHAVNRDPRVFHSPDVCILNRAQNKQMSYGFGSHFCIGAKLARIEMASVFEKILRAFPDLRLDPNREAIRKHHSLSFSGFERLHLLVG